MAAPKKIAGEKPADVQIDAPVPPARFHETEVARLKGLKERVDNCPVCASRKAKQAEATKRYRAKKKGE